MSLDDLKIMRVIFWLAAMALLMAILSCSLTTLTAISLIQ